MTRRVHVESIRKGITLLPISQAHHLRDVLRLKSGDIVELFDDAGHTAQGTITDCATGVSVAVAEIVAVSVATQITVASAVPKGDRADWMIEKLSELGVTRFIPLRTERSVVHPEGKGKLERWERIAVESAKQCCRSGVMRIESLVPLSDALRFGQEPQGERVPRLLLSTAPGSSSILELLKSHTAEIELFIGPEGGWSARELEEMKAAGLTPAALTTTILRIETAAVAAAAVVASFFAQGSASK